MLLTMASMWQQSGAMSRHLKLVKARIVIWIDIIPVLGISITASKSNDCHDLTICASTLCFNASDCTKRNRKPPHFASQKVLQLISRLSHCSQHSSKCTSLLLSLLARLELLVMSSDASAAASSPMTNGTVPSGSHREADASTNPPSPRTLADVCADLNRRVNNFLGAESESEVGRRTQEQTRIAIQVIEQALQDYEYVPATFCSHTTSALPPIRHSVNHD